MISFPIGLLATFVIFIWSMGIENLSLYFNFHSLLLVGGGTIALLVFSNPTNILMNLGRDCKELFKGSPKLSEVKDDLNKLARDKNATITTQDEMIKYAQDLWSQGTSAELFVVLLSQKKSEIEQRAIDGIQCLKNLAKYPPALGMAGTVMGIVTLFQTLEASKSKMGPALAMAMTATFFGLAIANAIVMPISDRLQVKHISEKSYLKHVYQVLLLINQDEASDLVSDEVGLRAG